MSGSCAQANAARLDRLVRGKEMDPVAFLHILDEAQLLSEGKIADILLECGPRAKTKEIADKLVDQGWLTTYQVERVFSDRVKELLIGQYRILGELGRGSFGRVYKARHSLMDRVVALKVITSELVEDTSVRSRFLREVAAVTHLSHPNIVMAYDANEADGMLFLVMEYVDGPDLDREVEWGGPLPIHLACAIMQQSARALQYAHDHGIVHRDIKPANLLRPRHPEAASAAGTDGQHPVGPDSVLIKVADFGLARLGRRGTPTGGTIQIPKDYTTAGTPAYMSPEQAFDIHKADIRSDLYSLGCTFYFALTGRCPFQGNTFEEIVSEQLGEGAKPVEWLRPQVPPSLAGIVRRLMAKDPEDRFQTPAEFVQELNYFHANQLNSAPACIRVTSSSPQPATEEFRGKPASAVTERRLDPSDSLNIEPLHPDSGSQGQTAVSPTPAIVNGEALALQEEVLSGPWQETWQQWYVVVQNLHHAGSAGIDAKSYELLHKDLRRAIQHQLATVPPERKTLFLRLEALAEPWLFLPSLAGLDRKTLGGLFHTCQHLHQELGCDARRSPLGIKPLVVACLLALAAVVAWFKLRALVGVVLLGGSPSTIADFHVPGAALCCRSFESLGPENSLP